MKVQSISALVLTFAISASPLAQATSAITRDALLQAAPVGTTYSGAESALLASGFVADGAIATTTENDPTRANFEKVTSIARFKAAPRVSYAEVKSIIDTKCVMCHAAQGGAAGLGLASYASVKAAIAKVQDRALVARTMPPMGPLAASEISLMNDFIAAGARESIPANFPAAGSAVTVQLNGSRDVSTPSTPVLTLDTMSVSHSQ